MVMQNAAATRTPTKVMDWLADGLPLALLVDLFLGERLDSAEVMRREGAQWGPLHAKGWPHPAA